MAYVIPSFNLVCALYSWADWGGVWPPTGDPRKVDQVCALIYGRRVNSVVENDNVEDKGTAGAMNVVFPVGADVRGNERLDGPDLMECPTNSGRWYRVIQTDTIGYGWPNAHGTAWVAAIPASWPNEV